MPFDPLEPPGPGHDQDRAADVEHHVGRIRRAEPVIVRPALAQDDQIGRAPVDDRIRCRKAAADPPLGLDVIPPSGGLQLGTSLRGPLFQDRERLAHRVVEQLGPEVGRIEAGPGGRGRMQSDQMGLEPTGQPGRQGERRAGGIVAIQDDQQILEAHDRIPFFGFSRRLGRPVRRGRRHAGRGSTDWPCAALPWRAPFPPRAHGPSPESRRPSPPPRTG